MSPVTLSFDGSLARVMIDNPPVNALSKAVHVGLLKAARTIASRCDVTAVILACTGRSFVAGSDIRELDDPQPPYLPEVLTAIETSRIPWVAAIHGTALGGGLELAMACHGRIADSSAAFGLPEVTLGIVPGAGGTVRLPRLVPMTHAIEIVTGGKPVDATSALAMGLVDTLSQRDLIAEAEVLAKGLAAEGPGPLLLTRPPRDVAGIDWAKEEARVAARFRGATAPAEALASLRECAELGAAEAMARARARFLRLSTSAEAAALRHIFFAERNAGQSLRATAGKSVDLDLCGVIGGGTMGAGIAAALLLSGSVVRLIERDALAAEAGRARIAAVIETSRQRGVLSADAAQAALARLSVGADYAALADCPLVIEAVFEDMAVKRAVFEQLDAVMPPDAILASNTSYLDVDALAAGTRDPARVLGLHFFSPAHVMKLLEVVRGARTGPRALATAGALARRLRKTAVVAGVCDGFIGNRIMAAYRQDCEAMLLQGADPAEIDAAMRGYGFAIGLFEVQDMSGLDIAWARRRALAAAGTPSMSTISDRLCEAGRLGRKAGRGWYDYEDGKAKAAPVVAQILAEESARAGLVRCDFTQAEIMARILRVMQEEGAQILAEGIAESADDIDVVMVAGYGFPRHRPNGRTLRERQ